MKDFRLTSYLSLIETLITQGFSFQTINKVNSISERNVIFLRQDVDSIPENSLQFARIQSNNGIIGTYYFRIIPKIFNESIITEIARLGHEIGYHYEDVVAIAQRRRSNGTGRRAQSAGAEEELVKNAIESFSDNLEMLRKIVPVNTICMHGSPMSDWDSRLLWKYYDYHDFGIKIEPYFDVKFEDALYLTDTGRRWNGSGVNIRDKAAGFKEEESGRLGEWEIQTKYSDWKVKPIPGSLMNMNQKSLDFQSNYNYKSTLDIIRTGERGELPDKMMMNFHPQRWSDKNIPWLKELVWQNGKNVVKYFVIKIRD